MDKSLLTLLREYGIQVVAPHYNGVHSSIVYTQQGSLNLVKSVSEAMNEMCLFFGSDLEGRLSGTRHQFNYIKNPPIIISECLQKVAFQLPSMIYRENMWIVNLNYQIEEYGKSKCKLFFDNQLDLDVPLSRQAIERQHHRAMHILYEVTNNGLGNNYFVSSARRLEADYRISVNHSPQELLIMESLEGYKEEI